LHRNRQADDGGRGRSGVAEYANLAVLGMAADAMMMHQQSRKEDHYRNAQNYRKETKCQRFAVSTGHMFWSAAKIATDIRVSVVY
jgi:hypothetical protein